MTTPAAVALIPVTWDGLALNPGYDASSGLTLIIEDVAGWLDSPPLDGGDIARALSDGAAYGPKVLQARVVTLQGIVVTGGSPADLPPFRDKLASRAANRQPAQLVIGDRAGRIMSASVRADSDSFKVTPVSPSAFRWQVTLTAADPRIYDQTAQQITLSMGSGGGGWGYLRTYPRHYALASLPSTAYLANAGNADAPAVALYTGPLASGSRLTDQVNSIILAGLAPGEQIYVQCDRLLAAAPGGASRASYIQPGSAPLIISPPGEQWSLSGSGSGTVQVAWQSAWI